MNREWNQDKENLIRKQSIKIAGGALAAVVMIVLITTVGRNLAQNREVSIWTLEELEKIGQEEGYPLDGSYVLEADIDGGGKTIAAIGSDEQPFAGHFDGQGHTISNLTVEVKKVREIRTKEVVKQAGEEEAKDQSGTNQKNIDQNTTNPNDTDKKDEPEIDAKGKTKKEEPKKAPQDSQERTAETMRYIISVDGYPLFEYTSAVKPGQIENLCLDGLKTQERKEAESTKEAETNQKAEGQDASKAENNTKLKQAVSAIEIHSWEEFKNIGNTKYNKAYTMDADYILVKAIKSDGKKFTPIGTKENPFTGTFDGKGMKIDVSQNKEIKTDSAYNGLFGVVKPAAKEGDHEK